MKPCSPSFLPRRYIANPTELRHLHAHETERLTATAATPRSKARGVN